MRMKSLFITTVLLAIGINSSGQDQPFDGHAWKAPYHLPAPTGWSVERFPLPPFFAPSITYTGIEDIRFTPGWAKKESEQYWSYAFVWFLGDIPIVDNKKIEENLIAYYTGLYKVNTDSTKHRTMQPVTARFESATEATNEWWAFTGEIHMTDYITHKPITLHARVRSKKCAADRKCFVYFELSPQPFDHSIWSSLDKLWTDFRCEPITTH